MGKTTDIAWTDHTFPPWIGCEPAIHPSGVVAQGCVNCYAAALNKRWKYNGTGTWGKGAPRKLSAESTWKQVEGWARSAAKAGVRRSVFFSLGDPLDQAVPKAWFQRYMDLIRKTACLWDCPAPMEWMSGGLRWLLLTKRPWLWERIPADVRPLVWLGTSASDPESWDLWVGDLVKAQGFAGLFVSLEPMIAPVNDMDLATSNRLNSRIDLVIVGGESGPKARPFRLEWARSVRDQCRAEGTAFYMKQTGPTPFANGPAGWMYPMVPGGRRFWSMDEVDGGITRSYQIRHPAGADPSEWPEDLRVRELPW